MTLSIDEWKKGLDAWEKIKKQALIDIEQAELYIKSIKEKMKELNEVKEK